MRLFLFIYACLLLALSPDGLLADMSVVKNPDGSYTITVPTTDAPILANAELRNPKILEEVLKGWFRGETQEYLIQRRTTALTELQKLEADLTRARLDAIIQGTATPPPTDAERIRIMDAVKKARGEK